MQQMLLNNLITGEDLSESKLRTCKYLTISSVGAGKIKHRAQRAELLFNHVITYTYKMEKLLHFSFKWRTFTF